MVSPSRALLSGLVGLGALRPGTVLAAEGSSHGAADIITNDTYFYGLSPPVYPSRELPRRPSTRG